MKRARLPVAVTVVLACFLAACGGPSGSQSGRSTITVEPTQTLLVMGSSGTLGDGLDNPWQDAWPRIFFRKAFPRATVFVNGATEGASVEDAVTNQLPLVDDVSPSVVAIWLGAVDAVGATPVTDFAANLGRLVQRVRSSGARVLIADLPELGRVDVSAYNVAIARVAAEQQATLVPLHAERVSSFDASRFLPDIAGQRVIAQAFERAMRG
jgi:lysophospholipase L1-like esterase